MIQINPPIPLDTPKGPAHAYFLVDMGPEHDDYWKCLIDATGEWWTFNNKNVRGQKNVTMGRLAPTPIQKQDTLVNGPIRTVLSPSQSMEAPVTNSLVINKSVVILAENGPEHQAARTGTNLCYYCGEDVNWADLTEHKDRAIMTENAVWLVHSDCLPTRI